MSEMKKVWLYMRTASPEQAETAFQAQKKTLLSYCKKKHYEIVGETACVGDYLTAQEVREIADQAEHQGSVDFIVASNMSRFTRTTAKLADIVVATHERGIGVKIAKIEGPFDYAFIQAIADVQRVLTTIELAEAVAAQKNEEAESPDFGMKME